MYLAGHLTRLGDFIVVGAHSRFTKQPDNTLKGKA